MVGTSTKVYCCCTVATQQLDHYWAGLGGPPLMLLCLDD
jgi:hypothetical protein